MSSPETAAADPDEATWDLVNLARARRLGDWMFEQFAHHVRGAVAEVGAGIGTFSERLLDAGAERLLLIEPEPWCARTLEQRFSADERVEIAHEQLPEAPSLRAASEGFDFLLCQNVLEHVEDDVEAVAAMGAALRPGGRVTLLVPAGPRLFGSLDESYGHHRRYTRARLLALAQGADLRVLDLYSFNLLGVPGWWLRSRQGRSRIGGRSLAVFEHLLGPWRPLERALRPPWGLSLILHAERPPPPTPP